MRRRRDTDQAVEIPPADIMWQLTWEQVLTAGLTWHDQTNSTGPDGVIIHRKYRGEDDALVYDIRCR